MKKGLINTTLYNARIQKGVSIKEAAKHLAVSRLRLSLIEKGYLNVPNRRLYFFIHYYKLPEDFFETHSTYVEPIEKDKIDFKELKKKGKKLANKKVRLFAYISVFTSACCVAFGLYANNRRFIQPRAAWTQEFTNFTQKVKDKGNKETSVIAGDDLYRVEEIEPLIEKEYTYGNSIVVYEKDSNSANTNIDSVIRRGEKNEKGVLVSVEEANFYLFGSNKKKVIYFTYTNKETKITIPQATVIISKEDHYTYELRPFYCSHDGVYERILQGTQTYNKVYDLLGEYLPKAYFGIDKFLNKHDLGYIFVNDLLNDIQKISRDYTLFTRLGVSFITVFSFTGVIFLLVLGLSYYSRYRLYHPVPKLSKETKEILNYEMPTREKLDDIRYPSFMPEFGVKSIGLIVLLLSSIAMFGSVYLIFNGNFIGYSDFKPLRDISSNFLSSAVLLLFFIKLDVYYRKNANQLLTNIITLFIAGLIFYIFEVLLFGTIMKDENIFSALLLALFNIVPGNVIWNIMLYSLIFYFLFTTPRKYLNEPDKVVKWRLCSLIPTFVLIFALFYKFFFEPKLGYSGVYISLMFHTSGIITTLFAILYLYSLYFFNLINKINYGVKDAEVYSYSRRYSLQKNIIASVIIVILFLIDTFFRYNIPDNNLKLGKNWAIILLVPIIMLYRPHIGKRPKTWDNIYVGLYGTFFAGGYISVALYVLLQLNIADLIYIRY